MIALHRRLLAEALGTMLLANWKRRKEPPPLPPQQNIIESTARKESL